MPKEAPIVRFEHISMQFPGVLANDDVSLSVGKGEVFALVGENGAGKSTLMNILYGLNRPTSGRLFIKGREVKRHSPAQAIAMGVGMVHQHFKLVPSFTVSQNILLACEPRKGGFLYDFGEARKRVEALSQTYGLEIDPDARVDELTIGLQQRVEILKTLGRGADVLILDEPTAVLTPQESEELFGVIRRMVQERGMTVIIITHKLYEVMAVSHRVAVMRGGKLVGLHETRDVNQRILAELMVGRNLEEERPERAGAPGEALIRVEGLKVRSDRGLPAVNGLSLTVRAGEILGVAAVEGNGQSELVEAICGMQPIEAGEIWVEGVRVNGMSPGKIRALGLAHVPEDRNATGVSGAASVSDNLLAGRQRERRFAAGGIHMKKKAIRAYVTGLFRRFDIRGAGVSVQAGSLSGGNMQKVVVAREFSADGRCLVVAQPTRGVDIGAQEFIHRCILDKRNAGCAILLVSADLDEVLSLSDRVITLFEGRITGEFTGASIDKQDVGYAMTGGRSGEVGA